MEEKSYWKWGSHAKDHEVMAVPSYLDRRSSKITNDFLG